MAARKPRLARIDDAADDVAEGAPGDAQQASAERLPDEPASEEVAEEEVGLSLEELGQTYAQLLGQGTVPYQAPEAASEEEAEEAAIGFDPIAGELIENDQCPITPLSILEAIMFVGRPDSSPIEADLIASMMRGVRSAEIAQLVDELNAIYASEGHVMRIVASGEGFRMQLADEFQSISDRFYGSVREIKLTQAAIDCLAIVAYRPGITREELEEQRGQPSGGILNQLVRRQLIEIRRAGDGKKDRTRRYYPTERMLKLAGIDSLDELPQTEDFER
ncbi:MAG: SMC-Scp complex subunit ScpB [Aureliella sp.]